MSAATLDYLAVGHLSRDRLPDGRFRLGGTVLYAAATAAAMGLRAAVLTRAEATLALPPLPGVTVEVLPSKATTTFRNHYDVRGRRTQHLEAVADPLEADDLPARWRRMSVLHLAPVAGECGASWADVAAPFVGLTPQGFLRRWRDDGTVVPAPWPQAERFLRHSDAVVLSTEDVGGDEALIERWASLCPLLVLTEGAAGGRLYRRGRMSRYALFPATLRDPTGAGDIFAAAFFVALRRRWPPEEAVRLAACLAAASVEAVGLAGVPDEAALHRCGWR